MPETNPLDLTRPAANAAPEVLAERARIHEIFAVLAAHPHEQAMRQALRAIRSGATRAELSVLGTPWSTS